MYKIKNVIVVSLLTAALFGCGGEGDGSSNSIISNPVLVEDTLTETPVIESPDILPPITEIPVMPMEPVITETPAPEVPVVAEPQPPTLPIFIGEGITTHTQQPYSGTIARGGDAYLRYNQAAEYFNDFDLPEWTVTYRYEPFLEVLITNGTETLCARYSWKKGGFGYAKPYYLWSDTRQALPLTDMQAAYYGYSVIETRVWVNGVVGLGVEVLGSEKKIRAMCETK